MRLPEFLTRLSPVGETLQAIDAGEQALARLVAQENGRVLVSGADAQGLSLWEQDFGLPDGTGRQDDERRLQLRAAMAGACTITPQYLRELCVTLGGADRGEVVEDFPNWAVGVYPVTDAGVPPDCRALYDCVRRLMPAHLKLELQALGELSLRDQRYSVVTGGVLVELSGQAPVLV